MVDSSSVEGGEITRVRQWIPSCADRHDMRNMTLCLPCQSVWLLVGYTGGEEREEERGGEGREKGEGGGGGERKRKEERGERRERRREGRVNSES